MVCHVSAWYNAFLLQVLSLYVYHEAIYSHRNACEHPSCAFIICHCEQQCRVNASPGNYYQYCQFGFDGISFAQI